MMQYQSIPPGVTVIIPCSLRRNMSGSKMIYFIPFFIFVNGHCIILPVALFEYFKIETTGYLCLVIHDAETVC